MKKQINYYHDEHHFGRGTGHGRGSGHGRGTGHGQHQEGYHRGNGGGGFGPTGICICLKCDYKQDHQSGVKCTTLKCPKCGHVMARKELVDQKKKN